MDTLIVLTYLLTYEVIECATDVGTQVDSTANVSSFSARDAVLLAMALYQLCVCLCVCVSVASRYCIETDARIELVFGIKASFNYPTMRF